MPRTILRMFLAALMLPMFSATARAQEHQPLAIILVNWNERPAGAPHVNTDLVYKSLSAAFADTLKKKLNVADPATIANMDMGEDNGNLRLIIEGRGALQPTTDEIVSAVRESFVDVVSNFFKDLHTRQVQEALTEYQNDANAARKNANEARAALQQLRAQLRGFTKRVDVSPDALRNAITRVEEERDKLALDSESMAVRREAIEATISRISDTAQKQIKNDRVAVELEKLVGARQDELKRVQTLAANNTVSQADLEAAESRVGEARVRLWERQEAVTRTAGGDLLADLNKELATISINMVESATRLKRLSTMVDDFAKAVDQIDELESAQLARQAAEQARTEAEARLAERTRELRGFHPPTVMLHVPRK